MRTFFHGWRRKAGIVSLGLACVLCGIWIRSMGNVEEIDLLWGEVVLIDGVIAWFEADDPNAPQTKPPPNIRGIVPVKESIWSIDFRVIVLQLTLLSAYLILWKPRKRA